MMMMIVATCIKSGARKEQPGMATGGSGSRRSPQVAAIAAAGIAAAAAALPAALSGGTGRRV